METFRKQTIKLHTKTERRASYGKAAKSPHLLVQNTITPIPRMKTPDIHTNQNRPSHYTIIPNRIRNEGG